MLSLQPFWKTKLSESHFRMTKLHMKPVDTPKPDAADSVLGLNGVHRGSTPISQDSEILARVAIACRTGGSVFYVEEQFHYG